VGRFIYADATRLSTTTAVAERSFDAVTFLLSIQDIEPLDATLGSASWALRPGGRVAVLMTHPCFRVPRQSGWGWDAGRRLQYRRVDRYLTQLAVPMKAYGAGRVGATRSYHRPLGAYVNGLAAHGLLVDRVEEVAAEEEIPLFLGIRALKRPIAER
jgi:hypothetical protein